MLQVLHAVVKSEFIEASLFCCSFFINFLTVFVRSGLHLGRIFAFTLVNFLKFQTHYSYFFGINFAFYAVVS